MLLLFLLNKLSSMSTQNEVVTNSNIGSSFLMVLCFILMGFVKAASPIIKKTLTIQLPITLAKAIVPFLARTLLKEMATYGAQVPKETIVRAINILGTLHFIAMDEAPSTNISLAFIIAIKPINKKITSNIISPLSILL